MHSVPFTFKKFLLLCAGSFIQNKWFVIYDFLELSILLILQLVQHLKGVSHLK